jgi:uracil-DNA glycosylase
MTFAERRSIAIGTMPEDWALAIGPAASAERLAPIAAFIADERDAGTVLPSGDHVFAALHATRFKSVRAVILGQDPYPNQSHAVGLAFSVPRDLPRPLPRSLVRIRAELQDAGWAVPDHGSLEAWTSKGVLLLNTTLTFREGLRVDRAEPRHHLGLGSRRSGPHRGQAADPGIHRWFGDGRREARTRHLARGHRLAARG